jgi:drug/metabolite transporter (DMT)-like permease
MSKNTKATFCVGIAIMSWSTVATAFKIALNQLTYFELLLVASCTALLIFSVVLTWQKKWVQVQSLSAKQWRRFAFMGLINPVGYYLALFGAYHLLPAQVAQPISYAWPIVLLLLLAFFAHQPIPLRKYIGMFISLGGVALIAWGSGNMGGGSLPINGLIIAIISPFLWATYWMLNDKYKETDSMVVLFTGFLFGTIYLFVSACFIGVRIPSLTALLSGIYVGAFEMGVPFIFFGLAIRKSSNPVLINQLCYLAPFISLFFISKILGEKIILITYIGLILIVSGIMFNEYIVGHNLLSLRTKRHHHQFYPLLIRKHHIR